VVHAVSYFGKGLDDRMTNQFFGEIEYGINTNRKLGKDLGNLGRLWE
jgi:hypothetical protein